MSTNDILAQAFNHILEHGHLLDLIGIVLSGIGSAVTAMIGFGVKFLRDMSKSIDRLNTNIEVLIARTDVHEKRIADHEERIRVVERINTEGDEDGTLTN